MFTLLFLLITLTSASSAFDNTLYLPHCTCMDTQTAPSFIDTIDAFLGTIVGYVWNIPLVVALVGTGILLTVLLKGIQFRGFKHAIQIVAGKYDEENEPGDITHFQALCTALSATVGLGNIAGVAVAISMGGPGAVFWMVVTGLIGMATKYAECTLAIMYREFDKNGAARGGPMYYIEKGLGPKFKGLAVFFAFATICGTFGAGNMFQTNQVASILNSNFSIPGWVTGLVLSVGTAIVILGGIKRIGSVTSKLVPFMGGIYVLGALWVIISNIDKVPGLFELIITSAFAPSSVAGGVTGFAISTVIIQGVRRACFSNEAGLGSSPIAHSAASTKEPVREGLVSLLEPLIDTVLICTMTALVILISGIDYTTVGGVELTAKAFSSAIPGFFGEYFIPMAVLLFAYSTLLSWSYYGEKAFNYLFGDNGVTAYKIVFCVFSFIGAIWKLGPVLNFSDIMLGLMVIPNLIALALLFPKVKAETHRYFNSIKN